MLCAPSILNNFSGFSYTFLSFFGAILHCLNCDNWRLVYMIDNVHITGFFFFC